jgi:hypothetical protein
MVVGLAWPAVALIAFFSLVAGIRSPEFWERLKSFKTTFDKSGVSFEVELKEGQQQVLEAAATVLNQSQRPEAAETVSEFCEGHYFTECSRAPGADRHDAIPERLAEAAVLLSRT